MLRFCVRRASSSCILHTIFCDSKSFLNTKSTEKYCFLWCFLTHKNKVVSHRERVSHYAELLLHLSQSDKQFFKKMKDIPLFEKLNNLNISVA